MAEILICAQRSSKPGKMLPKLGDVIIAAPDGHFRGPPEFNLWMLRVPGMSASDPLLDLLLGEVVDNGKPVELRAFRIEVLDLPAKTQHKLLYQGYANTSLKHLFEALRVR